MKGLFKAKYSHEQILADFFEHIVGQQQTET